jgi:hypothetical protein
MFQQLTDLIEEINNNPSISELIKTKKEKGDYYIVFIADFLNEDSGLPVVDKELLFRLDGYLCEEFINSNGGYSDKYYEAIKAGFKLSTLERDSFGPLVSGLTEPDNKWLFAFG